MNHVSKVARLHLNKPLTMFGVPAIIIALVLVVTVIISFILQRAGLDPSDPGYPAGARNNFGIVWSLPGFLIYYGVQAVATTFPFALAVGTTRRAYVLGTTVANLLLAAYVTAILTLLLALELATNHWYFGIYALDNYALGSGNAAILAASVFLGTFVAVTIGGLFGAVWVRFGPKGPTALGLGLAVLVVLVILAIAPRMVEIVTSITRPGVALTATVVAVLALIGTWQTMRKASVR